MTQLYTIKRRGNWLDIKPMADDGQGYEMAHTANAVSFHIARYLTFKRKLREKVNPAARIIRFGTGADTDDDR